MKGGERKMGDNERPGQKFQEEDKDKRDLVYGKSVRIAGKNIGFGKEEVSGDHCKYLFDYGIEVDT